MSGRLIILPKKSYCPWKPENVERVLRDERLERERQEQLKDSDRKKQSKDRVEFLKSNKRQRNARDGPNDDEAGRSSGGSAESTNHDAPEKSGTLEHVNLFADEEKAMMEKAVAGAGEGSASDARKKEGSSSSGIMPVYLGGEEAARRRGEKSIPFYLQPSSQEKSLGNGGSDVTGSSDHLEEVEAIIRVRKDERLKTQMDPMHEFCRPADRKSSHIEFPSSAPMNEDTEAAGVEKRHRRKWRHSYSSSSSSSESDSSSSSSSSSDEDDVSRGRKRKRRKRRERDKNRRRDDSKRRSSSRRDDRRRRDKKRSRKRHTKDDTALPSSTSAPSIDELRRRRQLREQKEAERSFMARLEDHSLAGASGNNNKYQDQYNPRLSRR